MTRAMRDRRRAERFAQLLDEADGGRRQHLRTAHDEELAELVALRRELVSSTPAPDLDPEFRTGLRAMLVATAEREGIGATAETPSPSPSLRPRRFNFPVPARAPRARTAVVAGVAVGAVAFTGMSTASEGAVPGDPLYGVKRSTERAQLALASSDVGRGQLYLDFARTRLGEAETVDGDLGRVLDDMDRDTSHGVRLLTTAAANRQDRSALDAIDAFGATQRESLETLLGQVSDGDRQRVSESLELLDRIDERSGELRRTLQVECGGTPADSIDALGPVPGACVALPPPSTLDLDSGLTQAPEQPSSPSDHGPDTEQGDRDRPAERPRSASDGNGQQGTSSSSPTDQSNDLPDASVPDEQPEPDQPTGETDAEQPASDDDGLLTSVNRLLGDLLAG